MAIETLLSNILNGVFCMSAECYISKNMIRLKYAFYFIGNLKYASVGIFIFFLILCTWSTNHFVGINARILKLIQQRDYKHSNESTSAPAPKTPTKAHKREITFAPTEETLAPPNYTTSFAENGSESYRLVTSENSSENVNISSLKDFISMDDFLVIRLDATNDFPAEHVLTAANVSENTNATMNKTFEKYESESLEVLEAKATGSLAAGIVSSVLWTASIYGLMSVILQLHELLVGPVVMIPIAGLMCFIFIFYDMGIVDVSQLFGGVFYYLMLVGAVVKIVTGCLLFYCSFIVYSYYKEEEDKLAAKQKTTESPKPTASGTPPRPSPPRQK